MFTNDLMDQKILTFAERQSKNKRKLDKNPRDNQAQQQPFKRENVARAYTAGPGEKKVYDGTLPLCTKCNYHHTGPCAAKCTNCKRIGHLAHDCRILAAANTQRALKAVQRVVTCYECGDIRSWIIAELGVEATVLVLDHMDGELGGVSTFVLDMPILDVLTTGNFSNLFQYDENQEEAVMLRTFPFSLFGEAKTWMKELDEGTITSWNEMREAFISRHFSPTKFKRLTKGMIIQIFYHGLEDPTQGMLVSREIFLYKTPNEPFKILKDKVLLKLDFSDDSQNNPKPKTIISVSGSNTNFDHAILMEKFNALATKIDFEFLIVSLTKGTIIQIFYHGLEDPTQGMLVSREIFLYKTPNEPFKILKDKVLLKLDFSDDSQNNPKPKTIVSVSGSNTNFDHAILMEKFNALATKIDFEFLI
nr:reverse transcriptase domain-containing protein [Tanacetum cinerariifolium]